MVIQLVYDDVLRLKQIVQLAINVVRVNVDAHTLLVEPGELVLTLRCHEKIVNGKDAMDSDGQASAGR